MSMDTEASCRDALSLIEQHLRSHKHSWSIGIPGAIGEFMYDEDEAVEIKTWHNKISARTSRGALFINPPVNTHCIAYRERSTCTRSWSQQVAFCIPVDVAQQDVNHVLTESGPDSTGSTDTAHEEILFDLGLGSEFVRFCIRTSDNDLLTALRSAAGQSVFAPDNSILSVIMHASPARVIVSTTGRLEVYGPIPANNTESPPGPHTHLLPNLLKVNKPGVFIPDGLIAMLMLYPEHPSFDKYGTGKDYDVGAEKAFTRLLDEFGSPAQVSKPVRSDVNRPAHTSASD